MSAFAANPIDLNLEQLFKKRFGIPEIKPPFAEPQIQSVPFALPGEGPPAARLGDEIAHTLARLGALIGFLAAAVVAVAVVAAVVATGGAALVVVAAVGAGMAASGAAGKAGAAAGSKHMGPPTGAIAMPPMHTVFINKKMAANATMSQATCSKESPPLRPLAMGSDSVDTLSQPSARKGDKVKCGAAISGACSPDVFIGGEPKPTMPIDDELPKWASWGLDALVIVGTTITVLASAGIIAGAVATGGAIAGGVATVKLGGALLIGKGMQVVGTEGGKLGASAFGYEKGSFVNDMSGIVGGEAAGLIKAPKGLKTKFNNTKFAQNFNQRYTKAYNKATDPNTKLGKWNAKTQVRAQNIKTGANKAIIASVLSAQLRMTKPKLGPIKPPIPKVIAAGTKPSTPNLVKNASAGANTIKGVSAEIKVKYDGGAGTFTKGGIISKGGIIPPKPTITITYKKAFPSKLVTKNKWMSVKTVKTKALKTGKNDAKITYDATTNRPIKIEGTIREDFGSTKRGDNATKIGKTGGKGYDGGHLTAHRFMKDQPDIGISPQARNLNRGAYKKMENEWADWVNKGYEVDYKTSVYPPGSTVPERFEVEYKVTDSNGKVVYENSPTFKNKPGQTFNRIYKKDMGN